MKLLLPLFLLSIASFSNAEPLEFDLDLIEGQQNIEPIVFSKINEKSINAKENEALSWTYTAECKTLINQTSSSSNSSSSSSASNSITEIFECTQTATTLSVRLIDTRIGKGDITIHAIGRDKEGKAQQDVLIKYDVTVLKQQIHSSRECPEWGTCRVYNGFYMGVDGTSVDSLNDNATLRVQYSAYSENFKHLHLYGDILQTTQQEQTKKDPECGDDCKSEPTIAGNIGTFFPLNGAFDGSAIEPSSLLFGPMVEFNTRKLDSNDEFAKSYYTGVRFGLNKVRYFAIGYGKAEGVPGHRVKFSGQLPLYNGKVLAGINLNVSADDESEEAGESPGDSINISLVTRVDFTRIFTSWSGD